MNKISGPIRWGIVATGTWLREVAAACGATRSAEDLIRDESERALFAVRADPVDRVFLFVCGPEDMSRLADPLSASGLPLIPFMCELGLRSRVVVFGTPADALGARRTLESLSGSVCTGDLVEFASFSTREELERQMRAPDAAAVYSEMFFDRRASRAGLPAFSSRIFEPGFDGAARTASRFRRLASLPFYRRYFGATPI